MIPYDMRDCVCYFRMQQKGQLHVANRTVESIFYDPDRNILDSTVRFQCPGRLSQEKQVTRCEGCPKQMDIAMSHTLPPCHIPGMWNLSFKPKFHMRYANPTKMESLTLRTLKKPPNEEIRMGILSLWSTVPKGVSHFVGVVLQEPNEEDLLKVKYLVRKPTKT